MSVTERLEDAELLRQAGRAEGALLSVLIAAAATSRKRRPRARCADSVAFTEFVGEEMVVITGGAVVNFQVEFRGRMLRLQEFFYKFLRCELAHEGTLPEDVRFEEGDDPGKLRVETTGSYLALSDTWMDGLIKAVQYAPENADAFPDWVVLPEDVLKSRLFGARRDGPHVEAYWAKRRKFAEEWRRRRK